ncbi:hypothetical protein [Mycobacterium sp. SMC-15]|uniref:DUF7676 family protein n=1 Tax=Mycobacterium sp. SMC-15 TaxID=3381627 RepID=UPI003876AB72
MNQDHVVEPAIIALEDGGREQIWPLPVGKANLLKLLHLCFDEYWNEIWFGTIIQGAAWEVAAPNPPKKISMADGYATIDFGRWHFHLCIGNHVAAPRELRKIRKCARAELYRYFGHDDAPSSWGVRLFNGRDEQMTTVLLPNPFLTNDQQIRSEPAWKQLELWDRLRSEFLGLGPDPRDRTGTRITCGGEGRSAEN